MSTDLLFEDPPASGPPYDLVFGDTGGGIVPDRTFSFVAAFPDMGAVGATRIVAHVSVAAALPEMGTAGAAQYNSNTSRPTVCQRETQHEVAENLGNAGHALRWQNTVGMPVGDEIVYSQGQPLTSGFESAWEDGLRDRRIDTSVRHQDADGLPVPSVRLVHQDGLRDRRIDKGVRYQGAEGLGVTPVDQPHQDGLKTSRNTAAVRWQKGVAKSREYDTAFQKALGRIYGGGGKYQQAWPPRPGKYVPPVVPGPDLCYIVPPGGAVPLVFEALWSASTSLRFVCETHDDPTPQPGETVVVPVRRVYVVLNSASLRAVAADASIPTLSMSMSLDVDSWTWSFSASVPLQAQSAVMPGSDGEPVEVEALVNGTPFRFLIESVSRSRTFGSASLQLSGRGKSALLDNPYAPTRTFTNGSARTAQQLMGDVLTLNGVPLDWTVDFQPTDWLVPAGAFAYQGSYMGALNTIAASCGAYVQPEAVDQGLIIKLRYPSAPWAWGDVTPDFELPSAVVTQESISWTTKPDYNRVFVSGVADGVLGQVTRTGTDGGLVAPMVTDALITHADAARQRGIQVLSDTGRIATVGLSLPVLSETGVIQPGKFVRYVDGSTTRLGLVRAVGVNVGATAVDLKQTITLEVHE